MNLRNLRLTLIAGASVAVLALAGCGSSKDSASSKNAKPGSGAAAITTSTSMKMDHGAGAHDMPGMASVLTGTATGESPCERAQAKPVSPGQANASGAAGTDAEGGHGARGMLRQLPVTIVERKLLQKQMIQARTVITKYPTVKAAEAAGYQKSTPFLPCIGAHYTNLQYLKFDPANPSELLFDGTNPDSHIIGLSYLVFNYAKPPEGFAGPNDHFHQHNANGGLCLAGRLGVVGGEAMSEKDCIAAGGHKAGDKEMKWVWMAHAWVVPGWECSWGVFAGECPELGGRAGGTAFDAPKATN